MIVKYTNKYKNQLYEHLDDENKKIFENSFFKKFIFVEDNVVKGWVILIPSKDRLLLDWIFVIEEFRKQKIGTKLMDFIKKFAKKNNFRGISVNTGSNTFWAREFYEKNGFEQVGSVKKFFKFDPEHIFYWFKLQ